MELKGSILSKEVEVISKLYPSDVVYQVKGLVRRGVFDFDDDEVKAKRKKITGYSKKSKRRYRFLLRNTKEIWSHEGSLSYGDDFPTDGAVVSGHLKLFIESLQRKYRGIAWTWRKGFQQERGKKGLGFAPHMHFLTDRFVDHKWLRERWSEIVGSSDPDHFSAGTHIDKIRNRDRIINYMVNYMASDDETTVPEGFENVGRFWGIKRGLLEYAEFNKTVPLCQGMRMMRLCKRWYRAELRSWGIYKWRPRWGKGFTVIGGRRLVDVLMKLNM